jgi:hypothetical protein
MANDTLSARELTRLLVARAAAQSGATDSEALAVHAAVEHTYHELARSIGASGSHALLIRGIAQAQAGHPLLTDLRVGRDAEPGVDGVAELVKAKGAPAVVAGLEAVLEAVLELLGRLVGPEMVPRLVDYRALVGTNYDEELR